jgi:lysophospholipid acyltransferase (LPLAT)-like uncharacterized protein
MKDFIRHWTKEFFAQKIVQISLAWILHFYIWLVHITSRRIIKGNITEITDYIDAGKGLSFFTWHGRILMSLIIFNTLFKKQIKDGKKTKAIVSDHRDGQIVGSVANTFNIEIIAGSTIDKNKKSDRNYKAISSIRNIMRTLNNGNIIILAADGPKGPAFIMNTKIVDLVQKTNTGIVCTAISYKRKKKFETWDKFELPYPFNTIIYEFCELVTLNEKEQAKIVELKLQKKLNDSIKNNDLLLKE